MKRNVSIGLLISVLFIASTDAISEDFMTEDQIRSAVSGKTCDFEKINPRKEKTKYFSAYFAEDGVRMLHLPWKGDPIKVRKWWTDGDTLCGSHPKRGDYCNKLQDIGDGVYHVHFTEGKYKGQHKRTFSNCREGKHIGS